VNEITAVGFVPSAPLLVPEVAGGSAHVDEKLRDACRTVVTRLCATAPEAIVVAASWPNGGSWPSDGTWSFEGFGVKPRVAGKRPVLPWPLGIGAWLLDDAGWTGSRCYMTVGPDSETHAAIGPQRVAVLVVGDGSARRSEKAPGHLDERAADFDAVVARALADGDVGALGGLDPELAAALLCSGAPAWHWLAATIDARQVAGAELLSDTAPYGVGYLVAWWRLAS
jgi:hypothetical protein